MRRTLVLAVILALPLAGLEAQSKVGVGVEFGYTRADLYGSDASTLEYRSGAVGSVFLDLRLSRKFAITLGPSLAQRGGTTDLSGAPGDLVIDIVTIDLPVLVRAHLPLGTFALLLEAGGMPGVRIGCNVEIQQGGVPSSRTQCNDPALAPLGDFAPWDVAAVAGVGVGIPVAGSRVGLKARYSQGFIPVLESRDIYNRSVSVLLELPF